MSYDLSKKDARWGTDEYMFGQTPERQGSPSDLPGMRPASMRYGGFYTKPILIVVHEGEPMEQYHVGAVGELEVNGMTVKTVVTAIDGRHVTCQIVDDDYEAPGD